MHLIQVSPTMQQLSTEAEIGKAYAGNETAARYIKDRFRSELHRLLHDRQVAAIQRLLTRLQPAKTLEIAPGPGRLTRDIEPVGDLVCLEFNEGMIQQGQAACGNKARWVQGNAFQLPFEQDFDLVYSFRFVRHFSRPDRERLYSEIRRVLRPGGCFLMDAVNKRVSGPLRQAHPEDYPIYDELSHPEELQQELVEAGLEVVELRPVQKWFSWQSWSQAHLGHWANWANRMLIRALEWLPIQRNLEWIVTCRRA